MAKMTIACVQLIMRNVSIDHAKWIFQYLAIDTETDITRVYEIVK